MNRSIRAHFDGKVIVPDEPVDWPLNQPLRVRVDESSAPPTPRNGPPDDRTFAKRKEALRKLAGSVSAPPIPPEALRRENLYDDRL